MVRLICIVQNQMSLIHDDAQVFATVTSHGTVIWCILSVSKMVARVVLSDIELANRLADPDSSSFSVSWDLNMQLKDGGILPEFSDPSKHLCFLKALNDVK